MTAPTLLELAKVAGTVEDAIVAEIVEDGGGLDCADGEEESHIIYQLASEVMVHRAAALPPFDPVALDDARLLVGVFRQVHDNRADASERGLLALDLVEKLLAAYETSGRSAT